MINLPFQKDNRGNHNIILPPPNITGQLHIGHALNYSLIDLVVKALRVRGQVLNILYSIDHAGIGAELVAYRRYGSVDLPTLLRMSKDNMRGIIHSWRLMGLYPGFIYFTLGVAHSTIVRDMLSHLLATKKAYKAHALMAYDIKLRTTLSDLEVKLHSTSTKVYTVRIDIYNSNSYLNVHTNRLDLMWADVAILTSDVTLVNQRVVHPLTKEVLPILYYPGLQGQDACMRFTPDFDMTDHHIQKQHQFNIASKADYLDHNQRITIGLFKGRHPWELEEDIYQALGPDYVSYRYVDAKIPYSTKTDTKIYHIPVTSLLLNLSDEADIVKGWIKSGKMVILPPGGKSRALEFLTNLTPWNINRQRLWGHSLAYFNIDLDCDVLDTWFSSALLPYLSYKKSGSSASTMVCGQDILLFWVMRMCLLWAVHHTEPCFKYIYTHPLICDKYNQKFSKSCGNAPDIYQDIAEVGVTAYRISLLKYMTMSTTVKYDPYNQLLAYKMLNKFRNVIKFFQEATPNNCNDDRCLHYAMYINLRFARKTAYLISRFEPYKVFYHLNTLVMDSWSRHIIETIKLYNIYGYLSDIHKILVNLQDLLYYYFGAVRLKPSWPAYSPDRKKVVSFLRLIQRLYGKRL